jgi:hypothetical protein
MWVGSKLGSLVVAAAVVLAAAASLHATDSTAREPTVQEE